MHLVLKPLLQPVSPYNYTVENRFTYDQTIIADNQLKAVTVEGAEASTSFVNDGDGNMVKMFLLTGYTHYYFDPDDEEHYNSGDNQTGTTLSYPAGYRYTLLRPLRSPRLDQCGLGPNSRY